MNQSDLTMDVRNQDSELIITLQLTKKNYLKYDVCENNAGFSFS